MTTLQNQIFRAFINAGLSENQARIITAEVGREGSFNSENVFGVHRDPKNSALNLGMLSWQGKRGQQLYRTLASNGLIENGRIAQNQTALDTMAKYAVHEMKTRPEYKQTAQTFLANPDIDYQTANQVLGRNFIRWRYDDPNYASGHRNRDLFYKQLGGGANASTNRPQFIDLSGVNGRKQPSQPERMATQKWSDLVGVKQQPERMPVSKWSDLTTQTQERVATQKWSDLMNSQQGA